MQDFDFIETPENVALERPLAGIGSRFSAGVLDNLLIAGLVAVAALLFFAFASASMAGEFSGFSRAGWWGAAVVIFALFALYWGYFVFFEMVTNGQSPGKKALRVRVVREAGGPITFTDIAIRNLLRAVDGFAFYGVGGICMFFTKKAQRLGDLAAGTVVVSEQVRDYTARTDKRTARTWEQEIGAEALRASGLNPQEFHVLYNYWKRHNELTLDARRKILPQLLHPILQRAGQQPDDRSFEALEAFVEALLSKAVEAEEEASRRARDSGAAT